MTEEQKNEFYKKLLLESASTDFYIHPEMYTTTTIPDKIRVLEESLRIVNEKLNSEKYYGHYESVGMHFKNLDKYFSFLCYDQIMSHDPINGFTGTEDENFIREHSNRLNFIEEDLMRVYLNLMRDYNNLDNYFFWTIDYIFLSADLQNKIQILKAGHNIPLVKLRRSDYQMIIELLRSIPPNDKLPTETVSEQKPAELKPTIKPEAVEPLFEILKHYFSSEEQPLLKELLTTGSDSKQKLQFNGNGNQLTDTFNKLFEAKLIVCRTKNGLKNWIKTNFEYVHNGKLIQYKDNTMNTTFSRKGKHPVYCKSPLIEIVNGAITPLDNKRPLS